MLGIEPEAPQMPDISVLLNSLPVGFLFFFLSLVVVQTHFLCKVLPYLSKNPLHPVSLTPAPDASFFYPTVWSLLSGPELADAKPKFS